MIDAAYKNISDVTPSRVMASKPMTCDSQAVSMNGTPAASGISGSVAGKDFAATINRP